MSPHLSERVVIARHPTTDGEIQLQQRRRPDGEIAYEIIVDGVFLMASYNRASEQALAARVLSSIVKWPKNEARVLVGGLGMGYTLQAVLAFHVTAVDVVELNPHIVAWNHTHFAALNGEALADKRVTIIKDDLFAVMNRSPESNYSAILLDVDNGPSWLAHTGNERLYTAAALARWAALLAPDGIFAVWSAQREPDFMVRMKASFGGVSEMVVAAKEQRDEPTETYIYAGMKRGKTIEIGQEK